MRELTADTIIRVKASRPPLTGETRIRLRQIVDLADWIRDRHYQIGEISQKTGLQKTAKGWRKPPTDKPCWGVPRSLGARAKPYVAKVDISVRKGKDKSYTLKEGSKVTDIETIAKGRGIDKINDLIKMYKRQDGSDTNATDWSKKKGNGTVVTKTGREQRAELHWYECQGIGKKDFKVKKWLDEKQTTE